MEKLAYDSYKEMTVASFNRMVNNLFAAYDKEKDFIEVYETVCSWLEGGEDEAFFLRNTIPRALDEYNARAITVYTGKQTDPAYSGRLCVEHKEDVFGDQILVNVLEADYTLTYRLLDAEKITVSQRDQFLEDILSHASPVLEKAITEGEVDENFLEKTLTEAGKKSESPAIALVDCEVNYLYQYDE